MSLLTQLGIWLMVAGFVWFGWLSFLEMKLKNQRKNWEEKE